MNDTSTSRAYIAVIATTENGAMAAMAAKAAKKAGNVAAEGAISIKEDGKAAVILEVNSQTDFLALQEDFKAFVAASLDKAFEAGYTEAAPLIADQEPAREALVAKTGENVEEMVFNLARRVKAWRADNPELWAPGGAKKSKTCSLI